MHTFLIAHHDQDGREHDWRRVRALDHEHALWQARSRWPTAAGWTAAVPAYHS